ncbi:hypothetical protein DID75_04665 [Candidatus Marinamargulisbacteria bacterium SCGC AG-410-N11]|nr:hypothetical protein DID75_04665 [Candidatus Marinamargulisbacteria bacterium SCGC AG-410-N11]
MSNIITSGTTQPRRAVSTRTNSLNIATKTVFLLTSLFVPEIVQGRNMMATTESNQNTIFPDYVIDLNFESTQKQPGNGGSTPALESDCSGTITGLHHITIANNNSVFSNTEFWTTTVTTAKHCTQDTVVQSLAKGDGSNKFMFPIGELDRWDSSGDISQVQLVFEEKPKGLSAFTGPRCPQNINSLIAESKQLTSYGCGTGLTASVRNRFKPFDKKMEVGCHHADFPVLYAFKKRKDAPSVYNMLINVCSVYNDGDDSSHPNRTNLLLEGDSGGAGIINNTLAGVLSGIYPDVTTYENPSRKCKVSQYSCDSEIPMFEITQNKVCDTLLMSSIFKKNREKIAQFCEKESQGSDLFNLSHIDVRDCCHIFEDLTPQPNQDSSSGYELLSLLLLIPVSMMGCYRFLNQGGSNRSSDNNTTISIKNMEEGVAVATGEVEMTIINVKGASVETKPKKTEY